MISAGLSVLVGHPVLSLFVICGAALGFAAVVRKLWGHRGVVRMQKTFKVVFYVSLGTLGLTICFYPFFKSLNAEGIGLMIPLAVGMIAVPVLVVSAIFALVLRGMRKVEESRR